MCDATYCTAQEGIPMFKQVSKLIARFFAPAFELIGQLPPQTLNRLVAPF
jgi:hypothetical protein